VEHIGLWVEKHRISYHIKIIRVPFGFGKTSVITYGCVIWELNYVGSITIVMGRLTKHMTYYYGVQITTQIYQMRGLHTHLWLCLMNIKNYVTSNPTEITIWERKEHLVIGNIGIYQVGSNSINEVFI
jgi:hypothetical protein